MNKKKVRTADEHGCTQIRHGKTGSPLSKNLSAFIFVNPRLDFLFVFASIRVHSRLDVLTGVDIEGNDDRLFPGGGRLFEVGQHFESGTGQLGDIVRQYQIDGTRVETSPCDWC
jgi:hypothetical protein